jgi:hypothetical protein
MKTTKNLGIWMDHSSASIMDYSSDPIETVTVLSKFTHEVKKDSLVKGEKIMHNKEQHEQSEYYKKLGETIKNYDDVILFGPTDAKVELLNVLRADNRFAKIKIAIAQKDKMSENQQHTFVKEYFSEH